MAIKLWGLFRKARGLSQENIKHSSNHLKILKSLALKQKISFWTLEESPGTKEHSRLSRSKRKWRHNRSPNTQVEEINFRVDGIRDYNFPFVIFIRLDDDVTGITFITLISFATSITFITSIVFILLIIFILFLVSIVVFLSFHRVTGKWFSYLIPGSIRI